MKIKKAHKIDIDTILKFQFLLHKHEAKFDLVKFDKEKSRRNTLKALSEKDVAYFVTYFNKKPVGYSEVYLKGKIAIMSSTYVLNKFRNIGIGKELFNVRKIWAKRKGAQKLRLEVYKKNTKTINVWKSLGYKKTKTNKKTIIMEQNI